MSTAGTRTVTVEEYLSNPAFKHSEYLDGAIVELNVGTGRHANIQGQSFSGLLDYLNEHRIGFGCIGLHCRLSVRGEIRYRRPDVCVVLGSLVEGYLDRAPELCIEIRSPQDSISDQIANFADYFANGCKFGWLVLPEERSVLILTPGATTRVARAGDALDGGDVLPGLSIPVADLFA